ncbi:Diamine N-acetyltransferase [Handroanthus impetiginosus]|uniref:Diamine N-acetyltransferase n=1 Tax=Handroanthus impetiginosus TaxID=429701 RepID=A0A2G9HYH7_9LAMI|nr:Diamine N-acetyltransferase [Handroanthus impetiginosus]
MERSSDSVISLRPLDISDADDFMKWYSDENVSKFCSWDAFTTKEAAIEHVANTVIPHPWYRAICLSGRPVGSISVTPFRGIDKCRAEIGYVVASEYWGKGIATAAVKMAANSVFVEWSHLDRLEAVVAVENTASQRVLEKAGFKREGVLRKYYLFKGKPTDAVIFSLLSTDPQVNYFMD